MGVPAFFRWLSVRYPKVAINALSDEDLEHLYDDFKKTNPNEINLLDGDLDGEIEKRVRENNPEFDNLYLDMNGIIHPCTHPQDKPQPTSETEMFNNIFDYTDKIMKIVRPQRLIYMAVDGVAPRAKMNQQRSRRFRGALDTEERELREEEIRGKWSKEGIKFSQKKDEEDGDSDKFDQNVITPGTEFMFRLSKALQYYVMERLQTDSLWKDIKVIFSDASNPGEGEHKILDFIRSQRLQAGKTTSQSGPCQTSFNPKFQQNNSNGGGNFNNTRNQQNQIANSQFSQKTKYEFYKQIQDQQETERKQKSLENQSFMSNFLKPQQKKTELQNVLSQQAEQEQEIYEDSLEASQKSQNNNKMSQNTKNSTAPQQQQVQGRDHFLNHRNDKFQQQKLNLNQKPINTNQQQQQLQLNKKQSNSPEKKQSTLTKNVVKFNLTSQTFGNQRPNNFRPKQTTQQQISPNKPSAISNGHQPSTGGFPNNNKQKYQNKQKQAVDDEMPNQAQKHTVTQDDLPIFLRKDHIRDAKMRRPSDPNYDKTTLHIPHNEWKQFTQCMVQYWKIKSENFDKIIFFKLGKFYEIFDYDAEICNKLLDINFMNNQNRMHVGFPEKNKDKYAEVLVQNGLTVMVVEQMLENKNQAPNKVLNKNYHQNPYKKYEKECVTRDICQIYSRGTFTDIERAQYDSKYVLALKIDNVNIGLCYFDVSTNKCFLGQFEDDESFNTLRTILAQIRAVEVIAEKGLINQQIEKMIKSSPQSPILHQYRQDQCPTALRTVTTFEKYIQEEKKSIDDYEVLKKLRQDSKILALQAFGIAIKFLENHLLATSCLKLFRYQLFEPKSMEYSAEFMILDSAAIEQLELIPLESTTQLQIEKKFERFNPNLQKDQQVVLQKPNTSQATLFDFINHTKTDFGNRLLKKWLLAPLMDIDKINDRLDAIEDLIQDTTYLHEFRDNISKMPDLDSLKSYRLDKLLTIKSDQDPNGLIPSLGKLIEEFEYLIVWKKVSGSEKEFIPEPHEGLSKQFDDTNAKVTKMKQQLDDYLKQIREQIFKINEGRFKKQIDQIGFTHSKFRYEIEVPLELVDGNKKPKEFELTSNKNGFQRFQTPQLKEMIEELEELEEELKEAIIPFVYALFQRFYDNRSYWDQAVMVMAELDCLTSLAIASQHQAPMCRPQFLKYEGRYRKKAYLELRQMRHPCIDLKQAQKSEKQQKKFVPNDTLINNSKSNTRILLVTGPNMGGKSTLLRQTCLAVILAQIGCFVPAESCILTPVDRIFTRIGASDRILEGKSTFFVEMEETNTILKNATFKSLAILDELGRGTSTFDGYSIAHAVLNYLTNYIKCRSLFSTHYHLLLDKFRDVEGIKSYHMACKQSETEQDRIEFLYKFIEGDCPQSFGMNKNPMFKMWQRWQDYQQMSQDMQSLSPKSSVRKCPK